MKDGLKQKLATWIEAEGGKMVPLEAIERQAKLWEYKPSNAERRLRELAAMGFVRPVMHPKKQYIVGYCYKSKDTLF